MPAETSTRPVPDLPAPASPRSGPGVQRRDVAAALKAEGVPFVFATGYGRETGVVPRHADVPLVRKPFTPSALIQALGRLAGGA
ncbi:MAG TPA: hypothetical protein VEB20_05025 [Azospirillaceae bacterium]|nr:hypothetical protein [Azospirillaceae bacterium]